MDIKEVQEYIRDNLTIEISIEEDYSIEYQAGEKIEVVLMLIGNVISTSSIMTKT